MARNVREFTACVGMLGLTGADANGARLLQLLEECGIDTSGYAEEWRGAKPKVEIALAEFEHLQLLALAPTATAHPRQLDLAIAA